MPTTFTDNLHTDLPGSTRIHLFILQCASSYIKLQYSTTLTTDAPGRPRAEEPTRSHCPQRRKRPPPRPRPPGQAAVPERPSPSSSPVLRLFLRFISAASRRFLFCPVNCCDAEMEEGGARLALAVPRKSAEGLRAAFRAEFRASLLGSVRQLSP